MPDLLTPQALATAGPLVLETLFKHFFQPRAGNKKHNEARQEDLMYDEAFILMKTFLETATRYPVSGLQRFGLVRTPAPPWVGIHRVCIPQRTLVAAADFLVTALGGEDMAYKVVGGTKWWQVRAGSGVEAEWIVLKKDWKEYQRAKDDKERQERERQQSKEGMVGDDGGVDGSGHFRKEMDELRCMLYSKLKMPNLLAVRELTSSPWRSVSVYQTEPDADCSYYWGSINTHRYTIWRYARKMHGRCFAVNYRKAPQYPFPCAIQDCLAAYLYLTDPPPEAKHSPVDPSNIVLAGDSAGGGLVLALLQILRDTPGLTLPAGAVLISPWSDLTHSFPSILENTATDIVPPFGFIHKPSSLWPPPPPQLTEVMQTGIRSRVKEAVHHLKPTRDEDGRRRPRNLSFLHRHEAGEDDFEKAFEKGNSQQATHRLKLKTSEPGKTVQGQDNEEGTLYPSADRGDLEHHPAPRGETSQPQSRANPGLTFANLEPRDRARTDCKDSTTLAQCNVPLELHAKDENIVVDTQIQLYATNAQLCHPWVSPILGYLGGLPPLLVCAGDHEVLRDEITYVAHKAANPDAYPIREDVRAQLPSLQGIEAKHGPTNVHFQIYDGTCHDLPLFSMTTPARGMFRAISSFARFCTPSAPGSLHINTPANSHLARTTDTQRSTTSSGGSTAATERPITETPQVLTPVQGRNDHLRADSLDIPRTTSPTPAQSSRASSRRSSRIDVQSGNASENDDSRSARSLPWTRPGRGPEGDDAGPRFGAEDASKDSRAKPGEAGHSGIYSGEDPFTDHMIRERVSTNGVCRPLEPASELAALNLPVDEVGVIKEGQATRYLNGQHLWDKKFHRAAKQVEKHRRKNLKNAKERDGRKLVRLWEDRLRRRDESEAEIESGWETDAQGSGREERRRGDGDVLDQSWSWEWALQGEAPPPSAIVSRRDFAEARNLALMADRMDDEHGAPIGGLSIWVGLATFFSNSQERNRAQEAVKQAKLASKAKEEEAAKSGRPADPPNRERRRFGAWLRSKGSSSTSKSADTSGVSTPA